MKYAAFCSGVGVGMEIVQHVLENAIHITVD